MDSFSPQSSAERDYLQKYFENVAIQGDQESKLLFSRDEGKHDAFSTSDIQTPGRKVVRLVAHHFPYEIDDVEQRQVSFGLSSRAWA